MYDETVQKPPFTAEEIRILGCLLEKQLTTPNNYPLTFNSLTLACNQKSSREPLMNLKEGQVGSLAKDLTEMGWATIQNSERAQRVEHRLQKHYKLSPQQQAVLAVLLLRRPQTLNEIKLRTERLAEFKQPDEIQSILDAWLQLAKPLVMRLPASSGKREDRYFHTLGTETFEQLQAEQLHYSQTIQSGTDTHSLEARVEALEQRVAELEQALLAKAA